LVFDLLSVRLCALFFLCLLAILFSEYLLAEDSERPAVSLGLGSVPIFPSRFAIRCFSFKITSRATHCIVWGWAYDEGSLLGVCSTTLALARLPARSCSAVKACPQVLHLHFAFGLIRLPVPNPLFSLGRNAMTNSPPHSRHCRLAMVTLFPRRSGRRLRGVRVRQIWQPKHPRISGHLQAIPSARPA
jgi:hypothetical protein